MIFVEPAFDLAFFPYTVYFLTQLLNCNLQLVVNIVCPKVHQQPVASLNQKSVIVTRRRGAITPPKFYHIRLLGTTTSYNHLAPLQKYQLVAALVTRLI